MDKSNFLVGHNYILDGLFQMIGYDRLHNALIFSGKKGIGKFTYALAITKFLLSHPIADLKNIKNLIIDKHINDLVDKNTCDRFLLITPAYDEKKETYKNTITVEEIRKINEFIKRAPEDNSYRIILIDSSDALNINATNALLKNLEEPTKNTLFILICHDYKILIDTIKSRSINISFKPLSSDNLLKIANYNNVKCDNNINKFISLAEGSYSNLLWYLKDDFGIYKKLENILSNNLNKDVEIYHFLHELKKQKNVDYSMLFSIIKNFLLMQVNLDNVDEIYTLIEKINHNEKENTLLNLDKDTLLSTILFNLQTIA